MDSIFSCYIVREKGVLVAMVAISILILPFMYILSILIKVNEVFNIGAIMSIYTLVFFVDNLYSVLSTQGTKTVGNRNYIFVCNSVHTFDKYYIIKINWRTCD